MLAQKRARAVLMHGHVARMLLPVAVALTCNKVREGRVKSIWRCTAVLH